MKKLKRTTKATKRSPAVAAKGAAEAGATTAARARPAEAAFMAAVAPTMALDGTTELDAR